MKAVLLRTVPPDRLIDLTHELTAHAVPEAAFVLWSMAREFPSGTVHLAVVDPGVGGARAPVAVECRDGSYLVGPDNGVLFPLAEALGIRRAVRLDPARIERPGRVGTTFDGRDLFAPAAARLARGEPISRLGPAHRLRPLRWPEPRALRGEGAEGAILHIDRFGNVITNVPVGWLPKGGTRVSVRVGRGRERSLSRATSYEALGTGRLGVLGSSFGLVELAVARGRAADRLRVRVGARVRLGWRPRGMMVNSEGPRRR